MPNVMDRRSFFKKSAAGAVAGGLLTGADNASPNAKTAGGRSSDKWQQMGRGVGLPDRKKTARSCHLFFLALHQWYIGQLLQCSVSDTLHQTTDNTKSF